MTEPTEPPPGYPPSTVAVRADDVAAFAVALDAPAGGVPPTYGAVYAVRDAIGHALDDEGLAIDVPRMLHGEQEFEWHRHPRLGEDVTATAVVVSDERNDRLRLVTLRADVRGADGRPVCTSTTVLVVR